MTREANAPPPVFFAAPGTPYSQPPLSKSTEGARDARVREDPRASTPRDIEACRSPMVPQVRRFHGVPRAVFEVCSVSSPVDFPFQAIRLFSRIGRPPIH